MTNPIRPKNLFLPELIEEEKGPWTVHEVEIRDSSVNLQARVARVPRALTRAQRLARLHELGHVKYTPRDYRASIQGALAHAAERGEIVDPTTVLQISKMLEENRVDWILWDRHGIDLRPAREALDWGQMQAPSEVLTALNWVLQLAWTVWASRGLSASIPNPPPVRVPDEATGQFFDQVWAVVSNHHPHIATAIVRGCLSMYRTPTHDQRDRVAAELSTFFPPPEELPKAPPEKQEEQQAQAEAEEEEAREQESREQDEQTGSNEIGSDRIDEGHYQIHDHTMGIRRPSMKIARRDVPQSMGTRLAFPQRYMLDKAVFARRILTEGAIMIDGSGSMSWNDSDLQQLLLKLPAVTIGIYGGTGRADVKQRAVYGRICVLAKRGRFSRYDPIESGFNGNNDVDLEALWLLARWPRPRFWLSDGFVCGGKQTGPHPDPAMRVTRYMSEDGKLVEQVNRWMRQHDILRVASKDDMAKLVSRKRVTLYRSCSNRAALLSKGRNPDAWYAPQLTDLPVSYQL